MKLRHLVAVAALGLAAACGAPDLEPVPTDVEPIGDFRMGFNIVVANDVTRAPSSREATEDELTTAVRATMEERLGRYDGDGLYHIGLRIEGYSLGRVGVPILYSPRSILLIAMNVWDDATQEKLTEEAIRVTAFESRAGPLVGSGLTRTREEQLAALSYNAAVQVEKILMEKADTWFVPKEDRERVAFTRDPETGRQLVVPEDDADAADPAPANSDN
jgi:hypothetical protein